MTLTIKVTGARDSPLRRFNWATAAHTWMARVEPLVKERLRQAAPVSSGPGGGRLRDSIKSEHVLSAANVVLTFTASVPYAGFVLGGTAPHDITFKKPQPLLFSVGWRTVNVVHHPGTRPNPFPERAIRPLEGVIAARLQAAIAAQLTP